jgi:multicomponent Na+:H+ antiporter subunit C
VIGIELLVDRAAYVVAVLLAGTGLYVLVDDPNLIKKVLGLNLFQTGIFLVFVAAAVRTGGRSPLVTGSDAGPYVNPLPHVLILTAIVVGVSVTALAAALVVRIAEEKGTVRADELQYSLSRATDPEYSDSGATDRPVSDSGASELESADGGRDDRE